MYTLKIYEHGKKPEVRQYSGELTDEVRQQWRRVLKFSRFEYELLPFAPVEKSRATAKKMEVKCQKMKQ